MRSTVFHIFCKSSYQWCKLLLSLLLIGAGQFNSLSGQTFRPVNSGTKVDIQQVKFDNDGNACFLAGEIYRLDGQNWKQLIFPVDGKISQFHPVDRNDIWFSISLETYTSHLYHYHDGITENLLSPFANFISALYFPNREFGLLAADAEIGAYKNGRIFSLKHCPTRNSISKLYGLDENHFWTMSFMGELYYFENGNYNEILKGDIVTDVAFKNPDLGYALIGNRVEEVSPHGTRTICKSEFLKKAKSISVLADGSIVVAGDIGNIFIVKDGKLRVLPRICKENLLSVASFGNQIWIGGGTGRLLYSGDKRFPGFRDEEIGFFSTKLVKYGVVADDEYGVAIADFNGDKKNDIYSVCIYNPNRLYMNNISGLDRSLYTYGFTEEAEKRNSTGLSEPGAANSSSDLKLGVTTADADNDGDPDLYISYLNGGNKLLLNNGKGFFRDVSIQSRRACEDMNRSNCGAFADIDLDGDLDLFVTSERGSNRLFMNDGTAHFTDVTNSSGLASNGGGMCASFADINNDGHPDLCVSFWYPYNRLYINESASGRIHFREITLQTDLAKAIPSKSNAVVFADVNNDGNMDLFIANRNNPNKLFLNPGNGLMKDCSQQYLPERWMMTNGAVFADFNLDGYQDLYLTNVGKNVLYRNIKGDHFEDVTSIYGAESQGYGTGAAVGDMDNDGDEDLYAATYINGNSQLYLNISAKVNSVVFQLKGTKSNRDAIGAKLWLYKVADGSRERDSLCAYRQVNGGSGYSSCSSKDIILALPSFGNYYALILFPCSKDTIRISSLKPSGRFTVQEEHGIPAFLSLSKKWLFRLFYDRENRPEIAKIAALILLVISYIIFTRRINRRVSLLKWGVGFFVLVVSITANYFYLFTAYQFSYFIAPLIAAGLMLILHLYIELFLVRRVAQREKQELREKLSRDLHDDLASTLGSISIYANSLAKQGPAAGMDKQVLSEKVNSLTQDALQSISDIIWMTSPRNDSLQSLLAKTCNQMQEIFSESGVEFSYHLAVPEEYVILPEKLRNDAFLILKEGTHNIIKHAAAARVEFKAVVEGKDCDISLRDDGNGFDMNAIMATEVHKNQGNGLSNMNKRATESGIQLNIISSPGSGTELKVHFRI